MPAIPSKIKYKITALMKFKTKQSNINTKKQHLPILTFISDINNPTIIPTNNAFQLNRYYSNYSKI